MLHNTRHEPRRNSLKSKRPRRRKLVTLIAGFRTYEGVVICADSQETLGNPTPDGFESYRCRVDKIEPQDAGAYQLVIGGAGDGRLVDGFTETLADNVKTWDEGLDAGTLKSKIRSLLLDYNRNEVAASSAREKDIHFLLCLKERVPNAEIHLWELGDAVTRVKKYQLIGWDQAIYKHDVQRLYRENAHSLPNMLLGIHVLLLAKATSNNVGPPIKIVVATETGISEIDQRDISQLEQRVEVFNKMLDEITLELSDTSVPLVHFRDRVTKFRDEAVHLHDFYMREVISQSFTRAVFNKTWKGSAVQELPDGFEISRKPDGEGQLLTFNAEFVNVEDLLDDSLDTEEPVTNLNATISESEE